ncbi:hypothetical protein [Agromyces lapidis]|uniref:CHAD domain-containing protein n=1 Tax=Agromyces lapidis TaxID=279574 RepID=A0ABV5STJ9_9MICO|nr:hypothetical protein [Agromyces lapidis]
MTVRLNERVPAASRRDRKRAKRAIESAHAVQAEVHRMAKRLPKGARSRARLESAVTFAGAELRLAEADRRNSPRLAAIRAGRVAARLDRASIRYAPRPGARGRAGARRPPVGADAAVRATAHAELVKRRRKQAEQAQKMLKRAAALVVGQAIAVSGGDERGRAERGRS